MIVVPIQQVRVAAAISIPTPTLHFRLNEAAGANDAIEVVSGLNLGQVNSPGAGTGVKNGCRTFNGSNQYFGETISPGDAAFKLGTVETIAAWVKLNTKAADHILVARGIGATVNNQDYTLSYNAVDDKFRISIRYAVNTFFAVEAATTPISTGTWYLVAFKWDGTKLYYSINGAAWDAGTAFSSTPLSTTLAQAYIGALPAYTIPAYMDGSMDMVTFWKGTALSSSDIASYYNAGAGAEFNGTIWV